MTVWFHETLDLAALTDNGSNCMPGFVGIEFVDYGDNWIKARMPVDECTKQPYGRLHGGASVLLAETLGSIAANHCVRGDDERAVGLEINANHVRPVVSGWVTGTARALHIGGTTQVWDIRIVNEQGKLTCVSRITMAVIRG